VYRLRWFTLSLVLLVIGVSPTAAAAPTLSISIYAPVQNDSLLHIVGFRYDEHGVQFALSNASDKSIIGAAIVGFYLMPPGCPPAPGKLNLTSSGESVYRMRIDPRKRAFTPREDSFPVWALVGTASKMDVAHLQVQFGVVDVDFADGTKWRPHEELPRTPFDPSLADADAGKCFAAAAVTKALSMIDGVTFDHGVEKPSYGKDEGEGAPPSLLFGCRLEVPKAVCSLP